MATKIRLQRHGRKAYPFYKIVVADSRAPRDGKFIEKLGTYNPNTEPATVDLDFERALHWLSVGAQPSDTARSILSHEGVLLKKHLLEGVKKGAFDEAAAEKKFEAWKAQKAGELGTLKDALAKKKASEAKAALEAEQAANKAKAAEVAAKKQAEAEAKATAEAPEELVEAAPAERVEETPVQEETPAEA